MVSFVNSKRINGACEKESHVAFIVVPLSAINAFDNSYACFTESVCVIFLSLVFYKYSTKKTKCQSFL